MIVYQFTHEDMQELANYIGNLPWVVAEPAMKIIHRVKELHVDTPKEDEVVPVEGK